MKYIATVKGYLSAIKRIETINPKDLKGWDSLSEDLKQQVIMLSAEISNNYNEILVKSP